MATRNNDTTSITHTASSSSTTTTTYKDIVSYLFHPFDTNELFALKFVSSLTVLAIFLVFAPNLILTFLICLVSIFMALTISVTIWLFTLNYEKRSKFCNRVIEVLRYITQSYFNKTQTSFPMTVSKTNQQGEEAEEKQHQNKTTLRHSF